MSKIISSQNALENLKNLASLAMNTDENAAIGILKGSGNTSRVVCFLREGVSTKYESAMNTACTKLKNRVAEWVRNLQDGKLDQLFMKNGKQLADRKVLNLTQNEARALVDSFAYLINNGADLTKQTIGDAFSGKFQIPADQKEAKCRNALKTNLENAFPEESPLRFDTLQKAVQDPKAGPMYTARGASIHEKVGSRSAGRRFATWLGRGFMRTTYFLRSLFTGRIFSGKWWTSVSNLSAELGRKDYSRCAQFKLPPCHDAPVEFDAHSVASVCAMSGKISTKGFPQKVIAKMRDPKTFRPDITDIKQNPALQDCWFLASISSFLAAQGPQAITRLFTFKDNYAVVRLADKEFKVPYADVLAGGKRVVSDSAPWVRMLEQAMSMYLAEKENKEALPGNIRMSYRSDQDGLVALAGVSRGTTSNVRTHDEHVSYAAGTNFLMELQGQKAKDFLGEYNDKGIPFCLHIKRGLPLHVSLKYGISPGHALGVVKLERDEDGDPVITVLDPYGRLRRLPWEELVGNFDASFPPSEAVIDLMQDENTAKEFVKFYNAQALRTVYELPQ